MCASVKFGTWGAQRAQLMSYFARTIHIEILKLGVHIGGMIWIRYVEPSLLAHENTPNFDKTSVMDILNDDTETAKDAMTRPLAFGVSRL